MLSGISTPVAALSASSLNRPELVSSDVGFVCGSMDDYRRAFADIGLIEPRRCREKAMLDYHYLRMAEGYVREYEREIAGCARTSSITTTA